MIKLLKNANVYAPEKLGKKDILIEGEKILLMQDTIEGYEGLPGVETYDLEGKTVVPAYIDMHVHITGGGGEQVFWRLHSVPRLRQTSSVSRQFFVVVFVHLCRLVSRHFAKLDMIQETLTSSVSMR